MVVDSYDALSCVSTKIKYLKKKMFANLTSQAIVDYHHLTATATARFMLLSRYGNSMQYSIIECAYDHGSTNSKAQKRHWHGHGTAYAPFKSILNAPFVFPYHKITNDSKG